MLTVSQTSFGGRLPSPYPHISSPCYPYSYLLPPPPMRICVSHAITLSQLHAGQMRPCDPRWDCVATRVLDCP